MKVLAEELNELVIEHAGLPDPNLHSLARYCQDMASGVRAIEAISRDIDRHLDQGGIAEAITIVITRLNFNVEVMAFMLRQLDSR